MITYEVIILQISKLDKLFTYQGLPKLEGFLVEVYFNKKLSLGLVKNKTSLVTKNLQKIQNIHPSNFKFSKQDLEFYLKSASVFLKNQSYFFNYFLKKKILEYKNNLHENFFYQALDFPKDPKKNQQAKLKIYKTIKALNYPSLLTLKRIGFLEKSLEKLIELKIITKTTAVRKFNFASKKKLKSSNIIFERKFKAFVLYDYLPFLELINQTKSEQKKLLIICPNDFFITKIKQLINFYFEFNFLTLYKNSSKQERAFFFTKVALHEFDLVLGADETLFCTIENLKALVVIDEDNLEYKKSDFNLKNLAILKAKIFEIPCFLQSSTLSCTSFYNLKTKKFSNLKNTKNPHFEQKLTYKKNIFFWENKSTANFGFSDLALEKIKKTLAEKGIILILLNQYQLIQNAICSNCGELFSCPNCNLEIQFLDEINEIKKCRSCSLNFKHPIVCTKCQSFNFMQTNKTKTDFADFFANKFQNVKILFKKFTKKNLKSSNLILATTEIYLKQQINPDLIVLSRDFTDFHLASKMITNQENFLNLIYKTNLLFKKTTLCLEYSIANKFFSNLKNKNYLDNLTDILLQRKKLNLAPYSFNYEIVCFKLTPKIYAFLKQDLYNILSQTNLIWQQTSKNNQSNILSFYLESNNRIYLNTIGKKILRFLNKCYRKVFHKILASAL